MAPGIKRAGRYLALMTIVGLAAGCASRSPAPVAERPSASSAKAVPTPAGPGFHTVKKGETLYSIALEYGQDYRDIVAWNGLENANIIRVGQQLRVAPPAPANDQTSIAVAKPILLPGTVETRPLGDAAPAAAHNDLYKREPKGGKKPYSEAALAQVRAAEDTTQKVAIAKPADEPAKTVITPATIKSDAPVNDATRGDASLDWAWPSKNKILAPFSEGTNSGIDFDGKIGDPVLAAAGGEVIFAKDGIRGFGNLVIIKHNPQYISVYAHNSRILVKEKQAVAKGQKIAELGSSDTERPKLHFEIRRQAKPVDPVKYLPQL